MRTLILLQRSAKSWGLSKLSEIETQIIKHVNGSDKPRDECERIMIYAMTLRQTIVDNNKPVTPAHDVYPLSPRLSKKLFNKKDSLDKQILELHRKKELDINVVELKGNE